MVDRPMNEIVTLTMNPALDVSLTVDVVEPEIKNRCSEPSRDPGGGGINVSRAIHELGGRSTAVFTWGGHTGAEILDYFHETGIPFRDVPIDTQTRENVTVVETRGEHQFRFNTPGVDMSGPDIDRCLTEALSAIGQGDILVLSGSLPPAVDASFYARLIGRAREADARTVLDTSGEPLRLGIEAGPDLTKPNMRELAHLTGRKVTDLQEAIHAADELIASTGTRTFVISHGGHGAALVTSAARLYASNPSVKVASTIGAGDSMVASLVLSMARGAHHEQMLANGVAAGAAAVMTPGTELLRRQDFERLREEVRVRASAPST